MLSVTLWELKHVRHSAIGFTVRSDLGGFQASYSHYTCTLDMTKECCGSKGVSWVLKIPKTFTADKHRIIAGLCYLHWFVACCLLKYSYDPMHYSLYIIPKHFERVFMALPFFSIQNPAMNKSINSKMNSGSSQLDWLSSELLCSRLPSGDDKGKHKE